MSTFRTLEEVLELQHQVEEKLKTSEVKVDYLKTQMEQNETVATKMANLLDTFTNRLESLEASIRPVHLETTNLTRARENIVKVLQLIEDVEEYYDTTAQIQRAIKNGPSYKLSEYLASLARVRKAIEYFEKNNPENHELQALNRLAVQGLRALENEFSAILERHSIELSITDLLLFAEMEEKKEKEAAEAAAEAARRESTTDNNVAGDKKVAFAQDPMETEDIPVLQIRQEEPQKVDIGLPEDVIGVLHEIADYLTSSQSTAEFLRAYAKTRSNLVLQAFAAILEPAPTKEVDPKAKGPKTPHKKGAGAAGAAKGKGMSRNTSLQMRRASLVPDQAKQLVKGMEGSDFDCEVENRPGAYVKGHHIYIFYTKIIIAILRREGALARRIVSEDLLPFLSRALFAPIAEVFIGQGELFLANAEPLLAEQQFFSLAYFFDVLEVLHENQGAYHRLVHATEDETLASRYDAMLNGYGELCRRVLGSFQDYVNMDVNRKLPEDGTVHEHTSNSLSFLSMMHEYKEAVANSLATHKPASTWVVGEEALDTIASWIQTVLKSLCSNITRKARGYEDNVVLTHIFLMNNYDYILRTLSASTYIAMLNERNINFESEFKKLLELEMSGYLQASWKNLPEILTVIDYKGQMSKKDRETVKERYTSFNDIFTAQLEVQKEYAVPSKALREQLRHENHEWLVPMYSRFDNAYRDSGFSVKNPQKYLKYTVKDVEDGIQRFFGAG